MPRNTVLYEHFEKELRASKFKRLDLRNKSFLRYLNENKVLFFYNDDNWLRYNGDSLHYYIETLLSSLPDTTEELILPYDFDEQFIHLIATLPKGLRYLGGFNSLSNIDNLTHLTRDLADLPHLMGLELRFADLAALPSDRVEAFFSSLATRPMLFLDLSNNLCNYNSSQMREIQAERNFIKMIRAVEKITTIKTLILGGDAQMHYEHKGLFKSVCKAIPRTIEYLSLRNIKQPLDKLTAEQFADALLFLPPGLKSLNLSGNSLYLFGLEGLQKILNSLPRGLEVLVLNDTQLDGLFKDELVPEKQAELEKQIIEAFEETLRQGVQIDTNESRIKTIIDKHQKTLLRKEVQEHTELASDLVPLISQYYGQFWTDPASGPKNLMEDQNKKETREEEEIQGKEEMQQREEEIQGKEEMQRVQRGGEILEEREAEREAIWHETRGPGH